MLGRAGISESLLDLEDSRVTVEQFNALFIAVKDSLNDECLGYLHGRPMRPGSFALMVRSAFTAHSVSYTHLDVYKRQMVSSNARSMTAAAGTAMTMRS